jgi:hypothetical protein
LASCRAGSFFKRMSNHFDSCRVSRNIKQGP